MSANAAAGHFTGSEAGRNLKRDVRYWPKRTLAVALRMSAFDGKADMTFYGAERAGSTVPCRLRNLEDRHFIGHAAQGRALFGQLVLARLQNLGDLRIVHHGFR